MDDHNPRRSGEQRRSRSMIIIQRNGEETVLTGWRAWLANAAVFLAVMIPLVLIVLLLLGIAITVGALALIMIPGVIAAALVATAVARWRARSAARR